MRYVIHTKDGVEIFKAVWNGEITMDLPRDYGVDMVIVNEPDPPKPIDAQALDVATNQALAADDDHLFSDTDDISEKQALEAALAQRDEELAFANERIAELESREPEVRIERVEVERGVEWPDLNDKLSDWDEVGHGAIASNIPAAIAELMEPGETLTHDVRRKLTERLNVELAELKNLRGLAGEDLKREAEIEKLLGLFARLGEI
jgi:hypothetical protein